MKIAHSPACRELQRDWYKQPYGSFQWRLAAFIADHTDLEIRDYLLTIIDEDPADSEPVAVARQLWPALLFTDPLHTPEELSDEIDSLTRDYEMLRLRTEALAAKFRALQPWSERWDRYPHPEPTFGDLNIARVVSSLSVFEGAIGDRIRERLHDARDHAAKIRVYTDTPEEIR